ncbi:MAR-binding filament-like protein 1-1 isoform X3 [Prunus dulcis]|uniref:MAR-binding filament-like protein 1-1 isoform X3 n=1 Tax=Prunus dulcis TaxID=3755 RepID=UPI001482BF6E|nr:MAR-binding filament-like protein 1-1 isoform X3 [Prunus dulcis]
MATVTATWSPSSLQLRLALNYGNCTKTSPILLRMRLGKLDHRARVLCVAQDRERPGNGLEPRRDGSSWVGSNSTADGFKGWSDSDNGEDALDSQRRKWFGGTVGAGVAGAVFVVGLTFAALSLGKRNNSRPEQKMEPLTTQQEMSLTYDDQNDRSTEDVDDQSNMKHDASSSPEGRTALQVLPGKVLVPAVVDQVQGQALAALQVLKVIEAEVQPGDLCTRREYARWLVSASSALSRNSISKVYPAMYIENVTELAFDDITPEDPDFSSIQGLAEAGLISSKLSRNDMLSSLDEDESPFYFSPESPLSRQDLVSWKMALEKRNLPKADKEVLYQISGFIDTDKIHPDACPALVADLSGEQGIITLAFGYTRLFQPAKPVTKAQAAIALATGEYSDLVSEELARIEAESIAENAVDAHNALVAEVEKDVNASFQKDLSIEREKIDAVEKMAEEARRELERLRSEREEDNVALMKERAAVESEMEVLSRLRHEVEEQLESLLSNKVEISYEKERISKLRKEAENESQEIARLQYDLEVERKALSMARAWAEDEAKRAREQAKVLEEARDRWERQGIKVVVDNDLREEALAEVTWLDAGKQFSVEGTVSRAENLMDKLKAMATNIKGKSRDIIDKIIQKIALLVFNLREWIPRAGKEAGELKDAAISKASRSAQELQQSTLEFSLALKEGAKRVAEDCRGGVEKLTQKFKT